MSANPVSKTDFHSRRPVCVVCGKPSVRTVSIDKIEDFPICNETRCRMMVDKRTTMSAGQFRQYLSQEARLAGYARLAAEQAEQRRQEMIATRNAQENAVFNHLATLDELRLIENPLRITIPTGPPQPVPLSVERRETHLEHLQAIISSTFSAPCNEPSNNHALAMTPPDPLSQRICAMCRGGCCVGGGDFAYLSVLTIRRIKAANPDLDAANLLDQYVSRIPVESMQDSCIYHTTEGCALPRELRSDTCNEYICIPLETLMQQRREASHSQTHVVAIQRRHGDVAQSQSTDLDSVITGAALIAETSTIPLNLPSTSTPTAAIRNET